MDKVIRAIKVVSRMEKAPTRLQAQRVEQFSIVDGRGMPTHPHYTRDELEWKARDEGARVVYYASSAEARREMEGAR